MNPARRHVKYRQAGGAGHDWTESHFNGCAGAVEHALPNFGTLWQPVHANVRETDAGSRLEGLQTVTRRCVPTEACQGGGETLSPLLDVLVRDGLAIGLAAQAQQKEQLEYARLQRLTGISKYVEREWRWGSLKGEFVSGTEEARGEDASNFAKTVLNTTALETFRVVKNIGHGLCGRIDEVTKPGVEGTFALKTVIKVSCVPRVVCNQVLLCSGAATILFSCHRIKGWGGERERESQEGKGKRNMRPSPVVYPIFGVTGSWCHRNWLPVLLRHPYILCEMLHMSATFKALR